VLLSTALASARDWNEGKNWVNIINLHTLFCQSLTSDLLYFLRHCWQKALFIIIQPPTQLPQFDTTQPQLQWGTTKMQQENEPMIRCKQQYKLKHRHNILLQITLTVKSCQNISYNFTYINLHYNNKTKKHKAMLGHLWEIQAIIQENAWFSIYTHTHGQLGTRAIFV